MKLLSYTLYFIGFVQFVLGTLLLLIPNQFASSLNLELPPSWVLWLFGNLASRFLGFSIGMILAAKDPAKNRNWIGIMIFVQIIDWISVMYYLVKGSIKISQVATAPFFPIFFVAILGYYYHKLRSEEVK